MKSQPTYSDNERARRLKAAIIDMRNNSMTNPAIIKQYEDQLTEVEAIIKVDKEHIKTMRKALKEQEEKVVVEVTN
jgi:septal ring factor EnvC (AmiA/AmiB activator)